jgi:hypothetical protein
VHAVSVHDAWSSYPRPAIREDRNDNVMVFGIEDTGSVRSSAVSSLVKRHLDIVSADSLSYSISIRSLKKRNAQLERTSEWELIDLASGSKARRPRRPK